MLQQLRGGQSFGVVEPEQEPCLDVLGWPILHLRIDPLDFYSGVKWRPTSAAKADHHAGLAKFRDCLLGDRGAGPE